ncbi:MAG: class I SAM-dependent methyltransferase [Sarcina sp.]
MSTFISILSSRENLMLENINGAIFNTFMLPFEKLLLDKQRNFLIDNAYGNILEVGSGTGINFNYYNIKNIETLTVVDLKFNKFIKSKNLNKLIEINYIKSDIESLPFKDNQFDSIVCTLVLCSVNNPITALNEFKRVLKPNGKLLVLEHIIPPNSEKYQKIAHKLNPTWHTIGKCNINRDTINLINICSFKNLKLNILGKECFIFMSGIYTK